METNDSADEPYLTPLHSHYKWVLAIRTGAVALVLLLIVQVLDMGPLRATPLPAGMAPAAFAVAAALAVLLLPARRYRAWGYREEEDELHVRQGLLLRMLSVVPFARVQHIDVAQGPIERSFGLATLILHTAGTRGASVGLPGLTHDAAERMRDRIRAKIRQDLT